MMTIAVIKCGECCHNDLIFWNICMWYAAGAKYIQYVTSRSEGYRRKKASWGLIRKQQNTYIHIVVRVTYLSLAIGQDLIGTFWVILWRRFLPVYSKIFQSSRVLSWQPAGNDASWHGGGMQHCSGFMKTTVISLHDQQHCYPLKPLILYCFSLLWCWIGRKHHGIRSLSG
jgi:hypothetical protein